MVRPQPNAEPVEEFVLRELLVAGDVSASASLLQGFAADPELPNDARTFIQALQSIVTGSRDRTLAEVPSLDYTSAAEILFLIETLEKAEVAPEP